MNMESGRVVTLTDDVYNCVLQFVVEKVGFNSLTLAKLDNPYVRLSIDNGGSVQFKAGPPGRSNIFSLESFLGTELFQFSKLKSKEKDLKKTFQYLAVDRSGNLCTSNSNAKDVISTKFHVSFSSLDEFTVISTERSASKKAIKPRFQFKQWQMRRFFHEGYLQIPNIVKKSKIDSALHYLNHHMGKPGEIVAGGIQTGESLGKFSGHISNCAAVRDLFRGEVEVIIDTLMHRNRKTGATSALSSQSGSQQKQSAVTSKRDVDVYEKNNLSGQVAFRFPELNNVELSDSNRDEIAAGVAWHTDGLRQGKAHGFSLLVGIVLSDIETEFSGNLFVWPGSHLLLHSCKTTAHGALDLEKLAQRMELQKFSDCRPREDLAGKTVKHAPQIITPPQLKNTASVSAMTSDTVVVNNSTTDGATICSGSSTESGESGDRSSYHISPQTHDNEPELPALGVPHQIVAKAGDVMLLHPDLAHAGGPNYSSNIRKVVYFRIKATVGSSKTAGAGSSGSDQGPPYFTTWEALVNEHEHDMWCDLPGLKDVLGDREFDSLMELYYEN